MRRICFFAHYDAKSEIKDYVRFYIKELKTVCEEIIFISVSNISDDEKLKLSPYIKSFINRENKGYDFGSWKCGMESVGYENLSQYDEVLLCNDSCFGPIIPFKDVFSKMEKSKSDAWSITTCYAMNYHMQSYFMVIKKQIFTKDWFKDFFVNISDQKNKIDYIRKYEVGFSDVIKNNDFNIKSYHKMPKYLYIISFIKYVFILICKKCFSQKYKMWHEGFGKNNSIQYKRSKVSALFRCFNVSLYPHPKFLPPIIKTMLFRDNPYSANLKKIEKAIKDKSVYDLNLINFIKSTK
jgi:lipopolysaccharide biosynthesis protein